MPLFNHFDMLAPVYDRLLSPPEGDMLLEILDLPLKGNILDAGGGTGRIAQLLTGGGRRVFVQDYSHRMLAQALGKEKIKAVTSETEDLPFPDDCFDRVVIVDAYHHLRDQPRSLEELWRVLKGGGLLVIEEPDIQHWRIKVLVLVEKLTLMRSHFHSPKVIADALRSYGAETRIERDGHTAWILGYKTE